MEIMALRCGERVNVALGDGLGAGTRPAIAGVVEVNGAEVHEGVGTHPFHRAGKQDGEDGVVAAVVAALAFGVGEFNRGSGGKRVGNGHVANAIAALIDHPVDRIGDSQLGMIRMAGRANDADIITAAAFNRSGHQISS